MAALKNIHLLILLVLGLLQVVAGLCRIVRRNRSVGGVLLVATRTFTFEILLVVYLMYVVLWRSYGIWEILGGASAAGYVLVRVIHGIKSRRRNVDGDGVAVLSSNLQYSNPAADACVRDLVMHQPDYMVVLEMTDETRKKLDDAMNDYVLLNRGEGPLGMLAGIWAHERVKDAVESSGVAKVGARGDLLPWVRTKVNGQPLTLLAVHLTAPDTKKNLASWNQSFADLDEYAQSTPGHLMVAGDFNAVLDHGGMRHLTRTLRDSASSLGKRHSMTWPTDGYVFKKFLPWPVMGIDHALLSGNLRVDTYKEYRIHGSDHAALYLKVSTDARASAET